MIQMRNSVFFILSLALVANISFAKGSGRSYQETRGANGPKDGGHREYYFRDRPVDRSKKEKKDKKKEEQLAKIGLGLAKILEFLKNGSQLRNSLNTDSNVDVQSSSEAIEAATDFFERNKNGILCNGPMKGKPITNQDFIIVNDFTKPMDECRQYIIQVSTGQMDCHYVTHGYGSAKPIEKCPQEHRINCGKRGMVCKIPVRFDDVSGQGTTLRGPLLTGVQYESKVPSFRDGVPLTRPGETNGVRMIGLVNGVNSGGDGDGKVWHRGAYVDEDKGVGCALSAGCSVVDPKVFEERKHDIDGGALIYNYTIDDVGKDPEC